jgi:hypothetical protein
LALLNETRFRKYSRESPVETEGPGHALDQIVAQVELLLEQARQVAGIHPHLVPDEPVGEVRLELAPLLVGVLQILPVFQVGEEIRHGFLRAAWTKGTNCAQSPLEIPWSAPKATAEMHFSGVAPAQVGKSIPSVPDAACISGVVGRGIRVSVGLQLGTGSALRYPPKRSLLQSRGDRKPRRSP